MNFRTQFEKCEDCGAKPNTEPTMVYQVTETRHLCERCAGKRASMVCDKDVPAEGACCLPEQKSHPFKCKHRTAGLCHDCEEFVRKQLQKMQLRKPPKDIQDKKRFATRREIELPNSIRFPRICCSNDDDELFIADSDSGSLFTLNLDNGEVVKIVQATEKMAVSDCKMVNSRELVLGNLASGCLNLCNHSGEFLDEITLPLKKSMKEVCVGTSPAGLIYAAKGGDSDIVVVNSQTRKYVGTICLHGKTVLRGIQETSSGKLVVQTDWAEFTVIDTSGQQETVQEGSWFQATCAVHPTRDLLYVFYSHSSGDTQTIHVDEMATTGEIRRRNILSFKITGALSLPLITSRMELIVCDGRSILVYE